MHEHTSAYETHQQHHNYNTLNCGDETTIVCIVNIIPAKHLHVIV